MRLLFWRDRKPARRGPIRILILRGEHEGAYGWCSERDRFDTLTLIPVDLDSGQHVHLGPDAVEAVDE